MAKMSVGNRPEWTVYGTYSYVGRPNWTASSSKCMSFATMPSNP